MAKVRDAMTRKFASVIPSASVLEVAEKMVDHSTCLIPVCEDGKLRGVITERGIITYIVATGDNPYREQAKVLMDSCHPMVSPGDDIYRAAKIMANNGTQALPVTQNKRLLGILTVDDVAMVSLAAAAAVLVKVTKEKLVRGR